MSIRKIYVVQCDYCGAIEEIKIERFLWDKTYWYPYDTYHDGNREPNQWSTDWYRSKDHKFHLCPECRREKNLLNRIKGADREEMLQEIQKELERKGGK